MAVSSQPAPVSGMAMMRAVRRVEEDKKRDVSLKPSQVNLSELSISGSATTAVARAIVQFCTKQGAWTKFRAGQLKRYLLIDTDEVYRALDTLRAQSFVNYSGSKRTPPEAQYTVDPRFIAACKRQN